MFTVHYYIFIMKIVHKVH